MKVNFKRQTISIIAGMVCVLFLALFLSACGKREIIIEGEANPAPLVSPSVSPEAEAETSCEYIYVHICGEVCEPGVYELEKGSRVFDAVEMAGGFTKEADRSFVNLAAVLNDGQKIFIPAPGEDAAEMFPEENSNNLVNINTASLDELCTLPGIGKTRAEAVIAYREEYGFFTEVSDLLKVNGIKEGIYNPIKDLVTVN